MAKNEEQKKAEERAKKTRQVMRNPTKATRRGGTRLKRMESTHRNRKGGGDGRHSGGLGRKSGLTVLS